MEKQNTQLNFHSAIQGKTSEKSWQQSAKYLSKANFCFPLKLNKSQELLSIW
jgi:hypothetical protein